MQSLTALLLIPNAEPPEMLLAECARLAISVRMVSTASMLEDTLAQGAPHLAILVSASEDAAAWQLLDDLHGRVPDVPVLWHCPQGEPTPWQIRDYTLFAITTSETSPDMIAQWLRAAALLGQERSDNADRYESLIDLRETAMQIQAQQGDFDQLLWEVLSTALQIWRASTEGEGELSGALLLMTETSQFLVRAAEGRFVVAESGGLPEPWQGQVLKAAASTEPVLIDNTYYLPLQWQNMVRGMLVITGTGQVNMPDCMLGFLASSLSTTLENHVLYQLAAIDFTTRIFTRSFTLQRLYESLKATYRTGQELTLLMMDLDRFKIVNDTFGHQTGDWVLNEIGGLLHSCVRETDILGRYGGDEFLAILPNTPMDGGVLVGRRIREALKKLGLEVNSQQLDLDISIGVSSIQCGDIEARHSGLRLDYEFFQQVIELMISQADGLMYRAKQKRANAIAHSLPFSLNSLLQRLLPIDEEHGAGEDDATITP